MKTVRRIFAGLRFFATFLWIFLEANLSVAYTVLWVRKEAIHPALADYSVEGLGPWEILFLAQLITLTPGTMVVHIDEKSKKLRIHILNTSDSAADMQEIRDRIQKPLLEVTRS